MRARTVYEAFEEKPKEENIKRLLGNNFENIVANLQKTENSFSKIDKKLKYKLHYNKQVIDVSETLDRRRRSIYP